MTTTAAEGSPRRRFTVVELEQMVAAGILEEDERILGYDPGRKADLYAAFGITELWVIDAVKLQTYIHRQPAATGYLSVVDAPPGQQLVPQAVPALAVVLSELELR